MKMTTSHRRHGVMRGKEEVEERGWETNDTTVRNLNDISTWKFITFFYVCVCVCWNVVTALHLTRHCGKHQLIRSLLAWFWKMFLSEKSGDNVMKKHLSFLCALTHPSYARSYFCMRQFYLVLPFKWTTEKKLQTPTLPSAIYAWKRRGFHTRLASFFFFFLNLPLYNLILLLTVSHNCRRLNWYLAIYFFFAFSLSLPSLV